MDSRNHSYNDRRVHQRVQAIMPVELHSLQGITRDVSPGGFCVELEDDLEMCSSHYFKIRLATDEPIFLTGMATVVRKENRSLLTSYGMQIMYSKIQVH